jgi:hypothetical protein
MKPPALSLRSAAMNPRAAAHRASAEAKREELLLKEIMRIDPSDRTDPTCFGTDPANAGAAPT